MRIVALSFAIAAAVGIIAFAAAPALDQNGFDPDERSVIAALRAIGEAERACRSTALLDVDGDGQGEYAFVGELAGSARLRLDRNGRLGARFLEEPLLPLEFAAITDGAVAIDRHLVQLHLPAPGADFAAEDGTGGGAGVATDPDRCEQTFRLFAWPTLESRGRHVFFVDETGALFACDNVDRRYLDAEKRPAADAAQPRDGEPAGQRHTGRDGNVWYPVR